MKKGERKKGGDKDKRESRERWAGGGPVAVW